MSGAGADAASRAPPEVAAVLAKLSRGEKLSNKERRAHAAWEEEESRRAPAAAGYGADGKPVDKGDEYNIAAFSVSQSAKLMAAGSAAAENSKDVVVENFSITAHKKQLFKNAELRVAHGRRYGIVGPNGQGKTTLLKHIAARELAIPSRISILYVEQEVLADDTHAVQAVLKADKKRAALLEEEAAILASLEAADAQEAVRLPFFSRGGAMIGAQPLLQRARRAGHPVLPSPPRPPPSPPTAPLRPARAPR
jgi:hypothetical protein